MRSLIKNSFEKGFSLPELTLAVGLIGVISLVTMNLVKEQKQNEAYLKARADISAATSRIRLALSKADLCKKMLEGKEVGTDFSTLDADGIEYLKEAYYGSFYLKANAISLRAPLLPGTRPGEIDLVIKFSHSKKNGSLFSDFVDDNAQELVERIPLVAKLDANRLLSCNPVVSDTNVEAIEEFCDSLGNSAIFTSGECRNVNIICPPGKVPKDLQNLGTQVCENIENVIDLSTIFDEGAGCTIGAGGVRIINVGGKFKIDCP